MKKLLIILSLASCTKQPITDQCGFAWQVKDIKTLDGKITLAVDTTWRSITVVCGQQFQNDKIMAERQLKTQFTSYCPNGETLYYYRLRFETE